MMGRRATLLLLAVVVGVAAAAAASASKGFLLTGPKRLLAGHVETFCISVEKDDQPLCSLDLISADDDTLVYASVQHQLEGRTGCMKLAVPKLRAYDGRLRLRMQGAGSADAVQVLKEVRFSTLDPIHLIETDKAWYTPGQLVRFRLLSLDRTLHPITHTIHRVYVEDPTGIAVAQWTNLTSDHGLHQLQVQLSSEPVQGVWRIVREDEGSQRFHQEFEVREFVLPKFEVVIKPPPSITYNDKSDSSVKKISLDVCAKYSYGQPVRGNWTAVIEVTDEDAPWFSRPPVKPITLLRNGVLDVATGCYSLKLPSDQLGVLKYDGSYDKTVKKMDSFLPCRAQELTGATTRESGLSGNNSRPEESQKQIDRNHKLI